MKKKGTKKIKYEKYFPVASILAVLLLIYLIGGQITGDIIFPRQALPPPPRSGIAPDILGFYQLYSNWFDFFIYFTIFLAIGLSTVGREWGGSGKAVFVGLALLLSFGILLWEEQTGISLLESFVPWLPIFIILGISTLIYLFVNATAKKRLFATGLSILTFYGLFNYYLGGCYGYGVFGYDFAYVFGGFVCWLSFYGLFIAGMVITAIGLFTRGYD